MTITKVVTLVVTILLPNGDVRTESHNTTSVDHCRQYGDYIIREAKREEKATAATWSCLEIGFKTKGVSA